jgi:effector-binding domain-containing protein
VNYVFDIVRIEPETLAIIEETIRWDQMSETISKLFNSIYSWLPGAPVEQAGHNHILYNQHGADEVRIRVGFPVSSTFPNRGNVHCMLLENGHAAHTTHTGEYSGLPKALQELNGWCAMQALTLTGDNWEVYGDWNEDPLKLTTDVYQRIEELHIT